MDKKLTFTGGEPNINFDDILRTPNATREAFIEVFRAFGDNYIIQGVTGTTSITAGYVMLDGEILKVDAHTKTDSYFTKVTTYEAGGNKTFNDATPRQTWQKNRATITASSGSLAYGSADRLADKIGAILLAGGESYYSISLQNSWAENAGGIGYGVDLLGKQFLVIDSLDGTSATADTICNLSGVSTGGRRRFLAGMTDSGTFVPLEIDSSGNLKSTSRLDFICFAGYITP